MKRKIFGMVIVLCMLMAFVLFSQITVNAEILTGTVKYNDTSYRWKLNTDTNTLTFDGDGSLFLGATISIGREEDGLFRNVFSEYVEYIKKIEILGYDSIHSLETRDYKYLEEIYIGKSVNYIRVNSPLETGDFFSKAPTITIEDGNSSYKSVDGVIYSDDMQLLCYPVNKKDETYTIPENIKTHDDNGNEILYTIGNSYLKELVVSEGVGQCEFRCDAERIIIYSKDALEYSSLSSEIYAYKDSREYEKIYNRYIKRGVPVNFRILDGELDTSGVYETNTNWNYSSSFKTLTLSGVGRMQDRENNDIDGIEDYNYPYWFFYAFDTEHIKIDEGITSIGANLFKQFKNLKDIIIPESVTEIGYYAFYADSNIENIYYAGTQEQWNAINIDEYGNSAIQNATIHYNYREPNPPRIADTPTVNNGEITVGLADVEYTSNMIAVFADTDGLVEAETVELTAGDTEKSVEIPSGATQAKIFIWDSLSNMRPLCEPVTVNISGE